MASAAPSSLWVRETTVSASFSLVCFSPDGQWHINSSDVRMSASRSDEKVMGFQYGVVLQSSTSDLVP